MSDYLMASTSANVTVQSRAVVDDFLIWLTCEFGFMSQLESSSIKQLPASRASFFVLCDGDASSSCSTDYTHYRFGRLVRF